MPYKSQRHSNHSKKWRPIFWESQEGKCYWCHILCNYRSCSDGKLEDNDWTVDHVIPLSHGGVNHWRNLVGSCYACNQKRGRHWTKVKVVWFTHQTEPSVEPSPDIAYDDFRNKLASVWASA